MPSGLALALGPALLAIWLAWRLFRRLKRLVLMAGLILGAAWLGLGALAPEARPSRPVASD